MLLQGQGYFPIINDSIAGDDHVVDHTNTSSYYYSVDRNCLWLLCSRHQCYGLRLCFYSAPQCYALLAMACLSVCIVTHRYCIKTNVRRMMPSSHFSTMYLVFGDITFINMFASDHL